MLLIILLFLNLNYGKPEIKQEPVLATTTQVQQKNEDKRVVTLRAFLIERKSPMAENAGDFIEVADKYGLDYRLLPAIAGAESTFGKFTPSCTHYNSFGWISTTSPCGWWRFKSFREAIEGVGQGIATNRPYALYRKTGKIEDLAVSYSGGSQTWIKNVKAIMLEIE